jgi:DnaK suppressor protein
VKSRKPINRHYHPLWTINHHISQPIMVNVSFRGCFAMEHEPLVAKKLGFTLTRSQADSRLINMELGGLNDVQRPSIGPPEIAFYWYSAKRCEKNARERQVAMATTLNDKGTPSDSGPDGTDIVLPDGYQPDEREAFMGPQQTAYFRIKLLRWKEEIIRESQDTLDTLKSESLREPDVADRASSETDWSLELRTRDRQRKLITKIDSALRRIEDGEYGYCEVTGEPISLARLEARPVATMTVEAQERHERNEKISRDE